MSAFGTNPNCADEDGDGFSVVGGDCSDRDPQAYPGAIETRDGVDNDCNGRTDDALVEEQGSFGQSVASPTDVTLPVRIRGTISSPQDSDHFRMMLTEPTRMVFKLRNRDTFQGWLFLYAQETFEWLETPSVGSDLTIELGAGPWTFAVSYIANEAGADGGYELTVSEASPAAVTIVAPPAVHALAGVVRLTSPAIPPDLEHVFPLAARFWVEREGWVGSREMNASGSAALTWSAVPDIGHCGLSYRVQYFSDGIPASPISLPAGFSDSHGGCSEATTFHRLTVNILSAGVGEILREPASAEGVYPAGTRVCLSAVESGGVSLLSLSGDGLDVSNCVTMSADRTISAEFGATPTPQITWVNTAGAGAEIAPNTWLEIFGFDLAPPTTPQAGVLWSDAPEFRVGLMPTQVGGVSVTVNGKRAYVWFVCSSTTNSGCIVDQVNVLTPLDGRVGPVDVVVNNSGAASAPFEVNMQPAAPSLLRAGGTSYVLATHADFSLVGPASLFPGHSTPAVDGETIALYGVGFGLPETPLTAGSASQSGRLPVLPVCTIGGAPATVVFAGLISPGLYQINLTVPGESAEGDNSVQCEYVEERTPDGNLLFLR